MSHNFLLDANFHLFLNEIDQEIAKKIQKQGCPGCGNRLHQANYPRSPMGLLEKFRAYYHQRLSFCCNTCRRRITPKSVRFFGRRWYPAPLFILISLLKLGISDDRLEQIKRHFGIIASLSTWKRWRRWWRDSFEKTLFWQQQKGLVAIHLTEGMRIPRTLLSVFNGRLSEQIILLLRFLSPLTGGVLRAV